jgi:hypothetical protein
MLHGAFIFPQINLPAHKRERGCMAGLHGRGLPESKRPEQRRLLPSDTSGAEPTALLITAPRIGERGCRG